MVYLRILMEYFLWPECLIFPNKTLPFITYKSARPQIRIRRRRSPRFVRVICWFSTGRWGLSVRCPVLAGCGRRSIPPRWSCAAPPCGRPPPRGCAAAASRTAAREKCRKFIFCWGGDRRTTTNSDQCCGKLGQSRIPTKRKFHILELYVNE